MHHNVVVIFYFRIKQREQEETQRAKDHMKKRMDTIIKLKEDISLNRVRTHTQSVVRVAIAQSWGFRRAD